MSRNGAGRIRTLLRSALAGKPSLLAPQIADAGALTKRLTRRLGLGEALGLAVAVGGLAISIYVYSVLPIAPHDYSIYVNTANGGFDGFYYAHWSLPFFWVLAQLPRAVGFALLNFLNIVGVWFAGRVLAGRTGLALASFQMMYVIMLGSLTGVLVGGLALAWWGLQRRRWALAGLGLAIAGIKPQLGLPLGLALWLLADASWEVRLRALIVPAFVAGASLINDPTWPLWLLEALQRSPPNDWGSIALWQWIGPAALLLWIPALSLKLGPGQRLVALAGCTALALPYFQQTDLLALYVLPIGWLPALLGNLGYLFFSFHFSALKILAVVPILVYLAALQPQHRGPEEAADGVAVSGR